MKNGCHNAVSKTLARVDDVRSWVCEQLARTMVSGTTTSVLAGLVRGDGRVPRFVLLSTFAFPFFFFNGCSEHSEAP